MKLLLYALLIFTISCSNNRVKEIKQIMSKSIKLPKNHIVSILGRDTIMNEYSSPNFKLVAYRDSSGCSHCEAKHLYEWESFMIETKKINCNVEFYYIFSPSVANITKFKLSLKDSQFEHPVIIDINNEFERLNPHLPKNKAMHTFLLDENNNVVLVGNPLRNPKIEKMLKEIV